MLVCVVSLLLKLPQKYDSFFRICPICPHGTHSMHNCRVCSSCFHSLSKVYPQCAHSMPSLPTTCLQCAHHIPTVCPVCPECTHGMPSVNCSYLCNYKCQWDFEQKCSRFLNTTGKFQVQVSLWLFIGRHERQTRFIN